MLRFVVAVGCGHSGAQNLFIFWSNFVQFLVEFLSTLKQIASTLYRD